jgi:hypothetical protein
MGLAAIRTQLKTVLEGVANIGIIHDYERWAAEWSTVLETFKVTIQGEDRIQAWTITRETTPAVDLDTERELRRHLMVMRGYRALDDSVGSEKEFQDLIETVCTALRGQRAGGLGGLVTELGPAQVRVVEHRLLASVLVHYAEITMQAEEVQG